MQVSLMLNIDEELDEAMLIKINQLWLKALHPTP
jgi:hypothetical protein